MTTWSERFHGDGADYDAAIEARLAGREGIHGEADLVASYGPASVLDAGCGTGRVAIELARRGVEVVGVDVDPRMLEQARRKAPDLPWVEADLAELDLGRTFDVAVAAGNVLIFVAPGTEAAVVARLAAHLHPGGRLVAGFQLRPGGLDLATYDGLCARAGLELAERYATWERGPWREGGDYAVSVHARRASTSSTGATMPV